jgi:uncharacterized protein (DUF983 family)
VEKKDDCHLCGWNVQFFLVQRTAKFLLVVLVVLIGIMADMMVGVVIKQEPWPGAPPLTGSLVSE